MPKWFWYCSPQRGSPSTVNLEKNAVKYEESIIFFYIPPAHVLCFVRCRRLVAYSLK